MVHTLTGFVANVIEWDGNEATWRAPDDYHMVEDTEGKAGPGGQYKDGEFIPAPGGQPGTASE
jgi:hypothetical protein